MTSRPRRLYLAGLFASTISLGCAHWDLGDPAPGFIDITTPPRIADRRTMEPAAEAGERMLAVVPAVGGSLGIHARSGGARAWASWAGQLTVAWGESDNNHNDRRFTSMPSFLRPERSWGLSLGGTLHSATEAPTPSNHGDLYLELRRTSEREYDFAAGPVWNPSTTRLGGQVTASLGPLYARTTMFSRYPLFQVGLMMELPLTWVWPR